MTDPLAILPVEAVFYAETAGQAIDAAKAWAKAEPLFWLVQVRTCRRREDIPDQGTEHAWEVGLSVRPIVVP